MIDLIKPKKPREPKLSEYTPAQKEYAPDGKGGVSSQWTRDYNKWQSDMEKYEKLMIEYTQRKNIRLVKNATEKYVLANYTITKKN